MARQRTQRPGEPGARYPAIDPRGCLTDVPGIRVGHWQRTGRGWRTGTTVVLVSDGATAGVDVRGGGPGTHETDLLRPENLVEQVHAICLTGGSAYGLAAATGVMLELEQRSIGFPVGQSSDRVVPIVPAAVIFDLGRGGHFGHRPTIEFGMRATRAARPQRRAVGSVGAGTGAVTAGLQGGVGAASTMLEDGTVVGALAVVNALGTVIDPTTGLPWESPAIHDLRRPVVTERNRLRAHLEAQRAPLSTQAEQPGSLNTTIGVVAVSARLTKAQCTKFASVAHDGLARAVRPAHTMFDGDTVFALATGTADGVDLTGRPERETHLRLNHILEAGAACFAAACTSAVLAATSWPGGPPSYRDLCPSAWKSER